MADDLNISRSWFHRGASYPHYDIPKKRIAEITAKCTLVAPRDILKIVKGDYMETNTDKPEGVNEARLNTHGKILFSAISAWLLGKEPKLKIRGTKSQIQTMAHTLRALKDFHEEMKKPDADVKTVMKKLGIKNAEVKKFEQVFGIKWPAQL
jgi:DNA-directed RNA polymerase beta' subunit